MCRTDRIGSDKRTDLRGNFGRLVRTKLFMGGAQKRELQRVRAISSELGGSLSCPGAMRRKIESRELQMVCVFVSLSSSDWPCQICCTSSIAYPFHLQDRSQLR